MNLRITVRDFAELHSLSTETYWTDTGLFIEFAEKLTERTQTRMRKFMRVTIAPVEVSNFGVTSRRLIMAQWEREWGR